MTDRSPTSETRPTGIRVIRSETDEERLHHFNVRFEAFNQATGFAGNDTRSPFEVDLFDTMPSARTLLTAYLGDEPVGAVRILWAGSPVGRAHGWASGLPIEGLYDLGPLATSGRVAEPGRLCVLPTHQGSGVALHLIEAVFAACRERGVDLLLAPANTETDCAEDVALLMGVLARKGQLSQEHAFVRKVPAGGPAVATRPLYSPEQRALAATGDLTGLGVPRTLKLYLRLGARVGGEAIFDVRFGLFALPIVVPVPDQPLAAAVRAARRP